MLPGVTAFYLFGGLGRVEDSDGLEVSLRCIVRLGEYLKVLFKKKKLRRPFLHSETKVIMAAPLRLAGE